MVYEPLARRSSAAPPAASPEQLRPDLEPAFPPALDGAHEAPGHALQRLIDGVARTTKRTPSHVVQRAPEIAATVEAMGDQVVKQVNKVNGATTATSGVHYAHNYQRNAKAYKAEQPVATAAYKPYFDFWQEAYWSGYADPEYFERTAHMSWKLKPMHSAAEAIKSWIKGPTIAECASVLVVIELDTLRAAIGDDKFDALFAEWPNAEPQKGLLHITQFTSTSSVRDYMGTTDEAFWTLFGPEQPGERSVQKGEWYYFYNHPQYLLKHPGGAFQGENAICMDDTRKAQKWAGFGVSSVTEPQMMQTMAGAYNAARNERDYEELLRKDAPNVHAQKTGANTYAGLYASNLNSISDKYRHDKAVFPDQTDVNGILTAAEYTLEGVTRKGGFVSGKGKTLDVKKVKAERDK